MRSVDYGNQYLQPYDPCRKIYTWFKIFGINISSNMFLNDLVIHNNADITYIRVKQLILKCCE